MRKKKKKEKKKKKKNLLVKVHIHLEYQQDNYEHLVNYDFLMLLKMIQPLGDYLMGKFLKHLQKYMKFHLNVNQIHNEELLYHLLE